MTAVAITINNHRRSDVPTTYNACDGAILIDGADAFVTVHSTSTDDLYTVQARLGARRWYATRCSCPARRGCVHKRAAEWALADREERAHELFKATLAALQADGIPSRTARGLWQIAKNRNQQDRLRAAIWLSDTQIGAVAARTAA